MRAVDFTCGSIDLEYKGIRVRIIEELNTFQAIRVL